MVQFLSTAGGCDAHRLGIARGWRMSAMNEVEHGSGTQFRLLSPHFCIIIETGITKHTQIIIISIDQHTGKRKIKKTLLETL